MSSHLRPLETLVLFLDEGLGQHIIAEALRAAGARVEIHADNFRTGEIDEVWLSAVANRGWVALTKDFRIRYREPALHAIRRARACVIVLKKSGDLSGAEMAAIFVKALPAINRAAEREPPPFIAKVGKDGRLTHWWPERPKKPRKE